MSSELEWKWTILTFEVVLIIMRDEKGVVGSQINEL